LFVTWRLHGSVPVPKPDVIYPTPVHAFVAEDRALDRSPGPQWLSDTRIARLQWIKGRTARDANLLLSRMGEPFWKHESYDHRVRSEAQFNRIAAYIEKNPVSAGL